MDFQQPLEEKALQKTIMYSGKYPTPLKIRQKNQKSRILL